MTGWRKRGAGAKRIRKKTMTIQTKVRSTAEALKMALDALETSARNWPSNSVIEAITAIKEALAQPEQKPDWYHVIDVHGCNRFYHKTEYCPYELKTPLYTTPPQQSTIARTWVGLTDEEREQMVDMVIADKKTKDQIGDLQRMVEAKLKEKNT